MARPGVAGATRCSLCMHSAADHALLIRLLSALLGDGPPSGRYGVGARAPGSSIVFRETDPPLSAGELLA